MTGWLAGADGMSVDFWTDEETVSHGMSMSYMVMVLGVCEPGACMYILYSFTIA